MQKEEQKRSTILGTAILISFILFLLSGEMILLEFDRNLCELMLLLGMIAALIGRLYYIQSSQSIVKGSNKSMIDFDENEILNMLSFPGSVFSVRLSGNDIIINYNITDTINADLLKEEDIGKVLIFHAERGVFTLYAGDRYGNENRELLYRCFSDIDEEDIYRYGYEPSAVGSFVSTFLTKNGFSADCRESAVKKLSDGLRNGDIALSGHQFR